MQTVGWGVGGGVASLPLCSERVKISCKRWCGVGGGGGGGDGGWHQHHCALKELRFHVNGGVKCVCVLGGGGCSMSTIVLRKS